MNSFSDICHAPIAFSSARATYITNKI
jgi:hypothetical protein